MPGLLNCALHANYFSTPQQFTQSVGRMDSGIVNTCIEHAYWTPPYLLIWLDWGLLHF